MRREQRLFIHRNWLPVHENGGLSWLVMVSLAAPHRPPQIKFNALKRGPITKRGIFVAVFTVNKLAHRHTGSFELCAHFFDTWSMLRRHLGDSDFYTGFSAFSAGRNSFKNGHYYVAFWGEL
jgi:hypothetical protein